MRTDFSLGFEQIQRFLCEVMAKTLKLMQSCFESYKQKTDVLLN